MEKLSTTEIASRIVDTLKLDPVLAVCVKSWSVGDAESVKTVFPFIAVEAPDSDSTPLTMGADGHSEEDLTINIYGGTRHILPHVAHAGNESTRGVIQLNSDIINAAVGHDFNGLFAGPVRLLRADTAHKGSTGGTTWMTLVTLSARRKTPKTSS